MAVIKCVLKVDPKNPSKVTIMPKNARVKKGDQLVFDGGSENVLVSLGDGSLVDAAARVPVKISAVHNASGFIVTFDRDKGDGGPPPSKNE
jgi:hypothetical protein